MKEYAFLNSSIAYEYLTVQEGAGLKPLVVGFERCKSNKGTVVSRHEDRFVLQYVLSGKGTLLLNGTIYEIGKNTMMLLPAAQASYAPDRADPWTYLWIEFSGKQAAHLLRKAGLSEQSPVCSVNNRAEIFTLFADMLQNAASVRDNDCRALYCTANLLKIFYELSVQTRHDTNAKEERLAPVLRFIGEHYAEPDFSVQSICKQFYLSASYLTRLFKNSGIVPPAKYIVSLRLEKARQMLESKRFTVAAVASACGYHSPYYFSLEFKRRFGTAPSRYFN